MLRIIIVALLAPPAFAGFNDIKAPIKPDTCRLANEYIMKSGRSGSAGYRQKGEYPTAASEPECYKKCEAEAASRKDGKPVGYGLHVACFYGNKILFDRTFP